MILAALIGGAMALALFVVAEARARNPMVPLTSTVMGSVPSHNSGIASAINNVAAQVAGLLAVAGLGAVVSLAFTAGLDARAHALPPETARIVREAGRTGSGIAPPDAPPEAIAAIADAYTTAFHRAMVACALLAFTSGLSHSP